jgi:hypothetical protein
MEDATLARARIGVACLLLARRLDPAPPPTPASPVAGVAGHHE